MIFDFLADLRASVHTPIRHSSIRYWAPEEAPGSSRPGFQSFPKKALLWRYCGAIEYHELAYISIFSIVSSKVEHFFAFT